MNDRPTPITDANLLTLAERMDANNLREMVLADVARGFEHILAELRELYKLDTEWLKGERDDVLRQLIKERAENAALKDALRVRIEYTHCPECDHDLEWATHAKTCPHYETERKVMQ